jgi:uncharacterized membrane protein
MLTESHERLRPVLERRDKGFRWRGREISRIEGLSDAVFAFAVTLLVVSLEPPRTFEQLQDLLHGFLSFGICFAMLITIWHEQYIYFRRYALDDTTSFVLNAVLLFAVAFYVYPLKFLFSTLVDGLTGYRAHDAAGATIVVIRAADWRPLMLIYGTGFVALYVIFALLYAHAYRLRDELELTPLEAYRTRATVHENLLMMGIGVASVLFALARHSGLAGLTYMLIAPLQTYLGRRHGQGQRRMAMAMAVPEDAV